MTYSSCCGTSNYSGLEEAKDADFSMYDSGSSYNNSYVPGINKVAEAYMSVPSSGKYQSVTSFV